MPAVPSTPSLLFQPPPKVRLVSLGAKALAAEPTRSSGLGLDAPSRNERPAGFVETLRDADRALDHASAAEVRSDDTAAKHEVIDTDAVQPPSSTGLVKPQADESIEDAPEPTADSTSDSVDSAQSDSGPGTYPNRAAGSPIAVELAASTPPTTVNAAGTAIASTASSDDATSPPSVTLGQHASATESIARGEPVSRSMSSTALTMEAPIADSSMAPTSTVAESAFIARPNTDAASSVAANNAPVDQAGTASAMRTSNAVPPTSTPPSVQGTLESGVAGQPAVIGSNLQAAAELPAVERPAAQQLLRPRGRTDQSPVDRTITPIESGSSSTPATARAMQVEAAVRLENTSGQTAMPNAIAANSGQQAQQPTVLIPQTNDASSTANQTATAFGTAESDQASDAPFAHRIVRGLSTMINQRGGVMNMRLDPPELGALRVQMTLNRGVVTAEFQASSAQAHAMLERNMSTLRSALEGQGLTVDRLAVHAPATSGSSFGRDDGSSTNQQSARQQQDAAGGESRGRRDDESRHSPAPYRNAMFSSFFEDSASHELRDLLAAV